MALVSILNSNLTSGIRHGEDLRVALDSQKMKKELARHLIILIEKMAGAKFIYMDNTNHYTKHAMMHW